MKVEGDKYMLDYNTEEELFKGLIPALNVKLKNLNKNKVKNITKEDIWNYLKETKWKNSIDLTLADMVQDIIHTPNDDIISNKEVKNIFN